MVLAERENAAKCSRSVTANVVMANTVQSIIEAGEVRTLRDGYSHIMYLN